MLTLCNINYNMKEQLNVKVTNTDLKITSKTLIWHKLCLNAWNYRGNRAPVALPQIGLKWCGKTRTQPTTVFVGCAN